MIVCVEDDAAIRDLMVYALNAAGLKTVGFGDGAAFFEYIRENTPQLVMLDIMLPGEDGISILKKLRSDKKTADIPVIMASAKGTEFDKVVGLDLGADDYLSKPFGMMEMVSRVKAVLRRAAPQSSKKMLRMGELTVNISDHTVSVCGERAQLTLKEFELLRLFLENPGIAFGRDQLLSEVWGHDFVGESRTVDVHIGTLRTKLGGCGNYIKTVRGVGYRMEGNV